MASVQETTFEALGNVLEQHYGKFDGDNDAVNYATLWNTLLDALQSGTLLTEDIDAEYMRIVQARDRGRAAREFEQRNTEV